MKNREDKWKEVDDLISKAKMDLIEVEEVLDDIEKISLKMPIKKGEPNDGSANIYVVATIATQTQSGDAQVST